MKNLINENTICRLQIDMPSSIDPVFAADTISREIIDNVYEKLFSFIGDNCVPILVKKWWIKFDKIYFFELKRNIYFHDGLECDSYAVQKSLIRMLNESKKANELFNGLLNPNNIVCLNKYLFSIELDKNCLDLIYFLAIQESSIISPRLLDNPTLLSETSSGTGPFKIKNIDTYNKEIILERFDNYWKKKPLLII
ncbi:ABC transporter substrate-binding protein [Clostridium sp.]|uniref:ABC transporter substrate-binding protein n=1 Tax=Clostridium sp. TaxID=1506 RepID=UPI0025BF92ED|nr:ABC transporter substrate-binding protein [Clostridium sp.]